MKEIREYKELLIKESNIVKEISIVSVFIEIENFKLRFDEC